ncbi:hypothetical protein E2542_SST26088 [Spatholobus suberectus]|nr:hypothetical protein E2542_SST26088 [Spatholobus suberectus]
MCVCFSLALFRFCSSEETFFHFRVVFLPRFAFGSQMDLEEEEAEEESFQHRSRLSSLVPPFPSLKGSSESAALFFSPGNNFVEPLPSNE